MNKQQAFAILNLDAAAKQQDIKKAYRQLSKQLHPDNQQTGNEFMYKQVQNAYDYLKAQDAEGVAGPTHSTSWQTAEEYRYTHSDLFGDVDKVLYKK